MPRRIKKSAPRRRPAKKAVRARRTRNVSEYASLSEVIQLSVPGNGYTSNTLYSKMDTSLDQFTRATQVAKAYQHYRIKYIQLKIKPTYDSYTSQQGVVNPLTKMRVYYIIDKSGSIPTNITLAGLKAMGAKPRELDEKSVLMGWRPSVLDLTMTAGGAAPLAQGAQYKISPWLNTNASSVDIAAWNPSTVDHLGIYWYVEQVFGSGQIYPVELEVQFEFKKPLLASAVGEFHAIPAQVAVLNKSRDGVVDDLPGGDDTQLTSPSLG